MEKKTVKCDTVTKATASLQIAVAKELENEDKPLKELIDEQKAQAKCGNCGESETDEECGED